MQQRDFIVLAGLGAADAVSLVGVDLGGQRRQEWWHRDSAPWNPPSPSKDRTQALELKNLGLNPSLPLADLLWNSG